MTSAIGLYGPSINLSQAASDVADFVQLIVFVHCSTPIQLDVWEYMPLLVRNKAAELLFGSIRAERVYRCYKGENHDQSPRPGGVQKENHCIPKATNLRKMTAEGFVGSCSLDAHKTLDGKEKHQCDKNMNLYLISLILLKMLLEQRKTVP